MQKDLWVIVAMVLELSLASVAECRTWYIKLDGTGDAPTIQAGIDSAQIGDDVLIAPGTYTWDNQGATGIYGMLHLKSGVWLHSQAGPELTVLGGELHFGSVIWCSNVDNSIIEGFTISGGVRDAFASHGGGGIHCDNCSSMTIIGNIITGNQATAVFGGAGGGGIFCGESPGTVISGNVIAGNSSQSDAGGIWCMLSDAIITGNTIVGNSASLDGGGVYCVGFSGEISGNVLARNTASTGGAIFCAWSGGAITNNTLVGNGAPSGAALYCLLSSSPSFSRNIVFESLLGPATYCDGTSTPAITCCDFWGNAMGEGDCALGADNFSADPMFCDEPEDDFHLHADSPCAPDNSLAVCGLVGALPVGCGPVPVDHTTWGRVKALYRK